MITTFHREAQWEMLDAMNYYDQRRVGLGDQFWDDIWAAISEIGQAPTRFPMYFERFRRCRAKTFPYKIIYDFDGVEVYIIAVMHDSRSPSYWRHRIR